MTDTKQALPHWLHRTNGRIGGLRFFLYRSSLLAEEGEQEISKSGWKLGVGLPLRSIVFT